MNSFELLPTEENLIETLNRDLLKRNKDLGYFYNILLSQKRAASIAIDGRWGSGKTFFVKQAMLMINAKNSVSTMEADKRERIINAISFLNNGDENSGNSEVAVYYDAWQNDNDIDPVLSLVYEIVKQLGVEYTFGDSSKAFNLAGNILEIITGKNINGIIENLKSPDPLAKIREERDLQDEIKYFFSELLKERGNRLVVFIDELDRCKPSYAVQVLERIKHYLCDDRITFIFSVNLEELQHTIKCYYGSTFDSCRYLDRFFDMRISLPPADKSMLYQQMGLNTGHVLELVCQKVIDTYNMELREIGRFYGQVRAATDKYSKNSRGEDSYFPEEKGKRLLVGQVVPILIGLKIVDISLYNEFICGKNIKPLMDIYINSELGSLLASRLLRDNETLGGEGGKKVITVEDKLQELYEAVFVTEYGRGRYYTTIGNYEFNSESKNFVKSVESMLSKYAVYEM